MTLHGISPFPNYLLSEPRSVMIEPSFIRAIARNFVTKFQITHGLKRDLAFIAHHAATRLARRRHEVVSMAARPGEHVTYMLHTFKFKKYMYHVLYVNYIFVPICIM